MLADHEWLEPGGLSVWLIPSAFLDVNYGRAVKEYLCPAVWGAGQAVCVHRACSGAAPKAHNERAAGVSTRLAPTWRDIAAGR